MNGPESQTSQNPCIRNFSQNPNAKENHSFHSQCLFASQASKQLSTPFFETPSQSKNKKAKEASASLEYLSATLKKRINSLQELRNQIMNLETAKKEPENKRKVVSELMEELQEAKMKSEEAKRLHSEEIKSLKRETAEQIRFTESKLASAILKGEKMQKEFSDCRRERDKCFERISELEHLIVVMKETKTNNQEEIRRKSEDLEEKVQRILFETSQKSKEIKEMSKNFMDLAQRFVKLEGFALSLRLNIESQEEIIKGLRKQIEDHEKEKRDLIQELKKARNTSNFWEEKSQEIKGAMEEYFKKSGTCIEVFEHYLDQFNQVSATLAMRESSASGNKGDASEENARLKEFILEITHKNKELVEINEELKEKLRRKDQIEEEKEAKRNEEEDRRDKEENSQMILEKEGPDINKKSQDASKNEYSLSKAIKYQKNSESQTHNLPLNENDHPMKNILEDNEEILTQFGISKRFYEEVLRKTEENEKVVEGLKLENQRNLEKFQEENQRKNEELEQENKELQEKTKKLEEKIKELEASLKESSKISKKEKKKIEETKGNIEKGRNDTGKKPIRLGEVVICGKCCFIVKKNDVMMACFKCKSKRIVYESHLILD